MESPAGSYALSLSDASVSDSDLGGRAPSLATVAQAANLDLNTSSPPECNGRPLFEPGDGDMRISVNGTCFETHKYLIKRFQGLRAILDKQSPDISVECKEVSVEDFSEMFKVLYASIVTGPLTFTPHTLVSTLRIATVYEYPALRDYCVQRLETLKLDAVKRIEIAHEFHLSAWEQPAYRELGIRDEPITREEARIIGLDAFVHIAKMREKEQRRRGKEIDAAGEEQAGKSQPPTPVVELVSSLNVDTRGEETGNNIGHGGSSSTQLPVPGDKPEANEAAHTTQCDTGAPIVPFLSAPSAPSSKPEVNDVVPHNDSGGVKAEPSLSGEPKDAHNWISRDGHEEGVDEAGVDSKDIDIVIQQTNCSRAKAVQTLKENNGDLINAIITVMEND